MSILRSHADADLSLFDYIHSVAGVARSKQNRAGLAIEVFEEFTQFVTRLLIERLKQWHLSQRFDVHLPESDGTVVTISTMRTGEKRQLRPVMLLPHRKS